MKNISKTYAYIRVSSKDQNLDRQREAVLPYVESDRDIVSEKMSGKDFKRPHYQHLKEYLLRSGDTLVIKELDRLGRDMQMIKDEWNELEAKGVNIVVIDTPLLNTEGKTDIEKKLISNIVFELLTYLAEKERVKLRQRQREGIDSAMARGVKFGKQKIEIPELWGWYYPMWKKGDITAKACMDSLGLKRTTFYKLVKEYEEENK